MTLYTWHIPFKKENKIQLSDRRFGRSEVLCSKPTKWMLILRSLTCTTNKYHSEMHQYLKLSLQNCLNNWISSHWRHPGIYTTITSLCEIWLPNTNVKKGMWDFSCSLKMTKKIIVTTHHFQAQLGLPVHCWSCYFAASVKDQNEVITVLRFITLETDISTVSGWTPRKTKFCVGCTSFAWLSWKPRSTGTLQGAL